jgi:hypothetical protein
MRIHLLILSSLTVGCASEPKTGSTAPEHYVWAGWNHTWEKLSHRVSFIQAIATPEGGLEMGIRGGDWSTGDLWADEVAYRMHLQRISGGDIEIVHGETELTLGPDGLTSTDETLSLSTDAIHVVLRGFEIDTDTDQVDDYPDYDPALGYTSRGFAMAVGPVDQGSGDATFTVEAQARWGPRDRDDMNAAMQVAQTQVRIAWTAIGHSGTVQTTTAADGVDLNHAPPYSEQSGLTLPTGFSGGPGIAGITGFDLGVSDQDGGDGGDYLRSFGVEFDLPENAQAPETLLTEVTTTSAIELGTMHFAPKIDMIWIDPEDDSFEVQPVFRDGTHPVGMFEIAPE